MDKNKTKLSGKLEVGHAIDRMIEVAGVSSIPQLAALIDISPQALQQAKTRGSLSLGLLMRFVARYGSTLDFVVWGRGEVGERKVEIQDVQEELVDDYIELESVSVIEELAEKHPPKSLKIAKEWLEAFHRGDVTDLKSYVIADKYYILDTSDRNIYKSIYALGSVDSPLSIRECERQLDGSILIEGSKEPWSLEKLQSIGVVGRVVWLGKATTVGY